MTSRACCCASPTDCLWSDVVTSDAGCCHSASEKLAFVIERGGYSMSAHVYGIPDPEWADECPGGCERHTTTVVEEAEQIQVIYDFYGTFFYCDYAAKDEAPERCDDCDVVNTTCCGPIFFTGCVCDPDAVLSPHQKSVMDGNPYWNWLIDSMCYDNGCGGDDFPDAAFAGALCTPVAGKNTLFNHLVCVVHREIWWRISECDGSKWPDPLVSPSGDIAGDWDCTVPKYWIYGCSGAPLYYFDLLDAEARGIITSLEVCDIMTLAGTGNTPDQALLRRLYDAGYIAVRDWRGEIVTELQDLKDRFPDDYAVCTVPACDDLAVVGPVRKRYKSGMHASCVTSTASALQPSLGACEVDPWSGTYPDYDSDEDYAFWRDRQWVYFHARPGYWTWVCADVGTPEEDFPDVAREYSPGCADGLCIDASGRPQDCTCTNEGCVGTNPTTGLTTCCDTCSGDCLDEEPIEGELACTYATLGCATQADGSLCINLAAAANCDGVHFVYTAIQFVQATPTGPCPYDYKPRCVHTNHAYLFRLNAKSGGYDDSCPYKCRPITPPDSVRNNLPDVSEAYLGHNEICDRIDLGCMDYTDLCCGSFCISEADGCTVFATGIDCPTAPTFEDHAEQEGCLP